jgi:translation elongation factor EF-Tu-like GTPase
MKVGIIGHIDPGKKTIIEALVKAVELKTGEQVEIVSVHANEKDFFNQPIIEKALSITNEMRCNLFTPPMTRAERRKSQRKNGKKRY